MRALIFIFMAAPVWADEYNFDYQVDCFCTDRAHERRELGEQICLEVDGRRFTAECQMSLNTPMWRKVYDGCLGVSLEPGLPLLQSTPDAPMAGFLAA